MRWKRGACICLSALRNARRPCKTIRNGKPSTPFLTFGDRARIEMLGNDGQSIFGAIEQEVVRYQPK